jgi:ABC-type multidrug transport system fused ATPase/permease subunit
MESGPHPELLRANGYYSSLVRRQQHGLIPNDSTENTG